MPSLKLTVRTQKWMVGIRSFPFRARPIFRGELAVSFREGYSHGRKKLLQSTGFLLWANWPSPRSLFPTLALWMPPSAAGDGACRPAGIPPSGMTLLRCALCALVCLSGWLGHLEIDGFKKGLSSFIQWFTCWEFCSKNLFEQSNGE